MLKKAHRSELYDIDTIIGAMPELTCALEFNNQGISAHSADVPSRCGDPKALLRASSEVLIECTNRLTQRFATWFAHPQAEFSLVRNCADFHYLEHTA